MINETENNVKILERLMAELAKLNVTELRAVAHRDYGLRWTDLRMMGKDELLNALLAVEQHNAFH